MFEKSCKECENKTLRYEEDGTEQTRESTGKCIEQSL